MVVGEGVLPQDPELQRPEQPAAGVFVGGQEGLPLPGQEKDVLHHVRGVLPPEKLPGGEKEHLGKVGPIEGFHEIFHGVISSLPRRWSHFLPLNR